MTIYLPIVIADLESADRLILSLYFCSCCFLGVSTTNYNMVGSFGYLPFFSYIFSIFLSVSSVFDYSFPYPNRLVFGAFYLHIFFVIQFTCQQVWDLYSTFYGRCFILQFLFCPESPLTFF